MYLWREYHRLAIIIFVFAIINSTESCSRVQDDSEVSDGRGFAQSEDS